MMLALGGLAYYLFVRYKDNKPIIKKIKIEPKLPPSRTKGNIMKNNTFNQVINANLASIDPGFGQFALAKASSDLFKKVLNK